MEKQRRSVQRKITNFYPDTGPLRRELYQKHLTFFRAGKKYRQRLALAANRVGKTEGMGLYELTLHLTGDYPVWWDGRRFTKPVRCWAAGDTSKTVREILQLKLLGPVGAYGTGLIPGDNIEKTARAGGVADTIEIIYVKHRNGGLSSVSLKSYDQRVEAFQGTEIDIILLDEEPPDDIYVECLMRTMTNNGMIMCTFTPLLGMSSVVRRFLPQGKIKEGEIVAVDENGVVTNDKFVVSATWDDVPHLSAQAKADLWASIPPFQRDARSKGVPQLGSGAIYPITEEDITCDDFKIPEHWPIAYGLDVGWNKTAAIWGAYDKASDTVYLYSEYYRGHAEPVVHAAGIRARGEWITGLIDPASRGRSQLDGKKLIEEYKALNLNLEIANNAVEAGILAVWQRMSTGKLKIFKSLQNTLSEYRLYRRDKDGDVVKEEDHLMDAMRYLVLNGKAKAKTKPEGRRTSIRREIMRNSGRRPKSLGWMGS